MRRLRNTSTSLLPLALLLGVVTGCKVTSADIQHWKHTVKGPGKLVAVLVSSRYEPPLRGEAGLALIEMERSDVDGLAEFSRALERLRAANDPALPQIVDGMVPGLENAMRGTGTANHEAGAPPPDSEVRAKDAAYTLARYAQGATRQRLAQAVINWYVADFSTRALAGNFSVEQVARELGAPAASQLVNALNAHLAKEALVKIAELVGQLGDATTKTAAGTRLVAIEREMETPAFLEWLKGEIRRSLAAQGQQNPTDGRVLAIATLNRENFINDGALPAMKFLANQAPVSARLLEIASSAPAANLPPAFAEMIQTRRQRALMALEGNVDASHLRRLLPLALSANNPIEVRDYAFDRIADTHSRDAIPAMWPLIGVSGLEGASEADKSLAKRLRWRAGELVLILGGPTIVPELFAHLPSAPETPYEPGELEGYATRMSQMTAPPTELMRSELRSETWWRRVIAIQFFSRRGTESDVAALSARASDATPTVGQGWARLDPPEPTVGKVATEALAALRQRLTNPSQQHGSP